MFGFQMWPLISLYWHSELATHQYLKAILRRWYVQGIIFGFCTKDLDLIPSTQANNNLGSFGFRAGYFLLDTFAVKRFAPFIPRCALNTQVPLLHPDSWIPVFIWTKKAWQYYYRQKTALERDNPHTIALSDTPTSKRKLKSGFQCTFPHNRSEDFDAVT